MQFAEIQRPAFILVVLLEQSVEPAEVVGCLRETFLDALSDCAPFAESDFHLFGVFAFFDCERAEESDEVVGDIVLYGGAVTDGVHGAERGPVEPEMRVSFEGVTVGLVLELGGYAFAEVGLRYEGNGEHSVIAYRGKEVTTYRHPLTKDRSPLAILS